MKNNFSLLFTSIYKSNLNLKLANFCNLLSKSHLKYFFREWLLGAAACTQAASSSTRFCQDRACTQPWGTMANDPWPGCPMPLGTLFPDRLACTCHSRLPWILCLWEFPCYIRHASVCCFPFSAGSVQTFWLAVSGDVRLGAHRAVPAFPGPRQVLPIQPGPWSRCVGAGLRWKASSVFTVRGLWILVSSW